MKSPLYPDMLYKQHSLYQPRSHFTWQSVGTRWKTRWNTMENLSNGPVAMAWIVNSHKASSVKVALTAQLPNTKKYVLHALFLKKHL